MAKDKELLLEEDDDLEQEGKETEYVAVDKPMDEAEEDDEEESSLKSSDEDDEDGEDRESIRERRRQEKKDRKERREKAISRDKIELNFLRQRNDSLERRLTAIESYSQQSAISDVDRQLQEAMYEAEQAERIIAKAVEAGAGEDVTQAMRYRDQAVARAHQLASFRQQQIVSYQPTQNNAPLLDGEVVHFAQEFMSSNPWYDPQGRDEDSAIVLTIDARLAQEGYDPRSEEYWDELQHRVARRLPEKSGKEQRAARRPSGGPAVGSGREHAPTSTRREVYISPERKAALQEAGVWDDPVLRQRYIKRYAEFDKQNKD